MELKAGYKQTEVGVIPETWQCCSLGDVVDLLTGLPFPSVGYVQSGVRLLRGSNVKRGCTDWTEKLTVYWPSITTEVKKYSLKAGDVVVAMDGSLVGRSFAFLGENDVPSLLLQRVARIRSDRLAQTYLKVWVCSQRFTNHCDAVKTASAIPHISPGDIRSFKVAFPPTKAEQEAIAEALSDADTLIESLDQLIAKKRQIKQGAMQELLTGKRRLPGFRGEWEKLLIEDIADVKTGPFGSALHESDYVQSGTPIITVEHLGEFGVTRQNLPLVSDEDCKRLSAYALKSGDIVFSRVGSVDRNSLISESESGWLFSGRLLRVRVDKERVFAPYLSFQFHTQSFKQLVLAVAVGQTMASLNTRILKNISVTLPSLAEQTAIATVLSDLDTELATLENRLAKARLIKQGMMQELLTGRIRLL